MAKLGLCTSPERDGQRLQSIGLSRVSPPTVERVKSQDVHRCLFKTLNMPGRFMPSKPFYEIVRRLEG